MADETPPDPTPLRPPVRMGLRVVARHSAGRHGGRALAHEVLESHRPKHLAASTRLRPVAARSAAPAAPPPAAAPRSGPEELPRGMTDFAAQWLFGDQQSASSELMSMAQ